MKNTIPKPSQKQERREELKTLIESIGLWNLNKSKLGIKYKVDRKTIAYDIKQIMKGVPKDELKEISFNLKGAYKKALSESQRILGTTRNNLMKLKAAETVSKVGEKFTRMLEDYKLKEKVADKQEIEVKDIQITMVHKYAKPKTKHRMGIEPKTGTSISDTNR